jgi:hypothetical protein
LNEQGNERSYNKVFTVEGARSKNKVNQVFNKKNQSYLIQPGNFQKPAIKSIRPKDLLAAKVSYDTLVPYKQYGLTYFIHYLGKTELESAMGPTRNTNTKKGGSKTFQKTKAAPTG